MCVVLLTGFRLTGFSHMISSCHIPKILMRACLILQVPGFPKFLNVLYKEGEGTSSGEGLATYSRQELIKDIEAGELLVE